jgi:PIN domain nuclease of toxin-antitoxin system
MNAPLLLDTCAVIWIANDEPVSQSVSDSMQHAIQVGEPVFVSPISAWEIGMLVARGRMTMLMKPEVWFGRIVQEQGMSLAEMPPELLIASSFLPGTPPRDPADCILAATAREYGYRLVTRDRPLLDYAEQGHIQALAC